MYVIVVKFEVRPEWVQRWPDLVSGFTTATRREPGNLWFEWSRSLENPDEFVLVEAFTDDGAAPHVSSEHFAQAMRDLPQALVRTPKIISRQVEGDGWEEMDELRVG